MKRSRLPDKGQPASSPIYRVKVTLEEVAPAIPTGWHWTRTGDVVREAQLGFASGSRDPSGVIQLRMNNVTSSGRLDWSQTIRVPLADIDLDRYALKPGDVLFNNTNSAELVGKSAPFEGFTEPVVFSNHFTRLRTDETCLTPEFLAVWLQERWNNGLFTRICHRWVGQAAVQRERLLDLHIPLPPIAEQKRITETLRERIAVVERARAAAEAQLEAAERLDAANLLSVFCWSVCNRWPSKQVAQVCSLLPSKSIANRGDMEVHAITTACLSEHGFRREGLKRARMRGSDATECVVRPGEVLVARSNTPGLVGRACLYEGDPSNVVASDLTIRIAPGPEIEPAFLAGFLSFLYLSGHWQRRAGGASGSMKKITRTMIANLEIPVPERWEQQRIARDLAEALQEFQRVRSAVLDELLAVSQLRPALLRRAFSGEL